MRPQRTTLAALVCAMFLLSLAGSGWAFAGVPIMWNEYRVVEEFNEEFESILGDPNIDLIPVVEYSVPGVYSLDLPPDFSFNFLGGSHVSTKLYVSATGIAKFFDTPPPTSPSSSYDLEYDNSGPLSSWQSALLMPFWGAFSINEGSGSGIYAGVRNLGSGNPMGSRVLIVEWKVFEQSSQSTIRFQMRLYEGTNIIEYLYDDRSYPRELWQHLDAKCGAAIGIKNLGQMNPCSLPQDEKDLSLIILNQTVSLNVHLRQPIYCGVTNTTCGPCSSTGNYTTWAELTSVMQPPQPPIANSTSFHYSLPTVDYRIKPVIVNVGGDTSGGGSRVCNVYNGGDTISLSGSFRNYGTGTAESLPVTAQLLRRAGDMETTLLEVRDTIATLKSGEDILHHFSGAFILPDTPAAGIYRVRLWCSMPGDWNRMNDTVTYILNVARRSDALACCINSPRLNVTGAPARYPINRPIPLSAGFVNAGTSAVATLPVRLRIVNAAGVTLHTVDTSLSNVDPGEERGVYLGYWTPSKPDLYYAIASTHLPGDDAPWNDLLDSYPYATPGRRTLTSPLPRIPFIVAYQLDLALIRYRGSDTLSVLPGGRVPINTTLANNGAGDQRNVVARARIVQRGTGRLIYTKSITINLLEAGSQQSIFFPDAAIPSAGTYELTISIPVSGDGNRGDNTLLTTITCRKPRAPIGGMTGSTTSERGGASRLTPAPGGAGPR